MQQSILNNYLQRILLLGHFLLLQSSWPVDVSCKVSCSLHMELLTILKTVVVVQRVCPNPTLLLHLL